MGDESNVIDINDEALKVIPHIVYGLKRRFEEDVLTLIKVYEAATGLVFNGLECLQPENEDGTRNGTENIVSIWATK